MGRKRSRRIRTGRRRLRLNERPKDDEGRGRTRKRTWATKGKEGQRGEARTELDVVARSETLTVKREIIRVSFRYRSSTAEGAGVRLTRRRPRRPPLRRVESVGTGVTSSLQSAQESESASMSLRVTWRKQGRTCGRYACQHGQGRGEPTGHPDPGSSCRHHRWRGS